MDVSIFPESRLVYRRGLNEKNKSILLKKVVWDIVLNNTAQVIYGRLHYIIVETLVGES